MERKQGKVFAGVAFWRWFLLGLALGLLILRLTGPTDLEGYAQDRNVGYIMDAVWEGNWLAQEDIRGRVMSKPPMHTWMAGAFSGVFGLNRFAFALPSFFGILGLIYLVFGAGRKRFGDSEEGRGGAGVLVGGFAALAFLLAPLTAKHIALVRTDALFACCVAFTAFSALRVWEHGGGWLRFWAWATAATLVKGPVGILLGAAGLFAVVWERRTHPGAPRLRGAPWGGLVLLLGVAGGWFLVAVAERGPELLDKMLFDELFGQATGARKDSIPGENLPKPALYFLARFLPFSLFAFYGMWRVVARPAMDAGARRFERFLFCWIVGGLVLFSLAAHHRADLLLPLWAPGALLAGREMYRLYVRIGEKRFIVGLAAIGCMLLGTTYWNYHHLTEKRTEIAEYGERAGAAARALLASGIDPASLYHVDTPTTFQLDLKTFRPWSSVDWLLARIEANETMWVAVSAPEEFPALFGEGAPPSEVVFSWPNRNGEADSFLSVHGFNLRD